MPKLRQFLLTEYSSKGFSLIEILVAIGIILLVSAVSIPNIRRFGISQQLDDTAGIVFDVIRHAQSGANSGIVCSQAAPGAALNIRWQVQFQSTSVTNQIVCNYLGAPTGTAITETRKNQPYGGNVTLQATSCGSSAVPAIVEFSARSVNFYCNGVLQTGDTFWVRLSDSPLSKTITIDRGGAVTVQ